MLGCFQSIIKCNRHIEYIDKRHQNLKLFPSDVIKHHKTLEELLIDSNQLQDLPKVKIVLKTI
jgi:protein scribble